MSEVGGSRVDFLLRCERHGLLLCSAVFVRCSAFYYGAHTQEDLVAHSIENALAFELTWQVRERGSSRAVDGLMRSQALL